MISGTAMRQADFAAALLDPALACPEGLHAYNGSDPTTRFAVHRNNVVSSLLDALADTFPVVQELVGVEFFRAMAAVFVRRSPPRSSILAHYGHEFPQFIAGFEPADAVPYLADMAALELARVRAYHAADADALAPQPLRHALSDASRIGELRVAFHPSVSIVSSPFAVVSLWAAHQSPDDTAAIDIDHPEQAIVLRAGLAVLVLRLPAGGAEFAQGLMRGESLTDAAGAAALTVPSFDLSAVLALLMGHGALTSIHLPQGGRT
jgi:hypothetical protein